MLRSSIRTIIFGQCFGAPLPQVLINGGVFSLLILQLGGSKFEVGLVFMLNFLAQIIRVFSARYADVRDTRSMYIRWAHTSNLVFLLFFLVEPIRRRVGADVAIVFACAVFLAQRVAINVGATAWQPMLAAIVPPSLRGRFSGAMRMAFQSVSLVVILLAGAFLGDEPSIWRFYVVFAVLLLLSSIRPFLILRLPKPAVASNAVPEKITRNIARPFRDAHFRRFLLFWGYLVFAINLARPFTVPFLKQDLGFPSSMTIYTSSLLVMGMAISLLRWGRLADRLGNRLVFLVNIVLMAVSFLFLALTPVYDASPVFAVVLGAGSILLMGVAIGGQGIAHTVRTMNAAPDRFRGSYMSAFFIVNGIIAGITSSVSGLILDLLPATITLFSHEILLLRLYFPGAAILILVSLVGLVRITPVSELPIRETMSIFVESLPSVISLPLQAVRIGYRRNDQRAESGSRDDSEA